MLLNYFVDAIIQRLAFNMLCTTVVDDMVQIFQLTTSFLPSVFAQQIIRAERYLFGALRKILCYFEFLQQLDTWTLSRLPSESLLLLRLSISPCIELQLSSFPINVFPTLFISSANFRRSSGSNFQILYQTSTEVIKRFFLDGRMIQVSLDSIEKVNVLEISKNVILSGLKS